MNVSVIIITWNRDSWLKRLIDTLLYQTYDDFEIIVVNGPSIDKTDEILEIYKDFIKIRKCDVNNISVSRNIGIKAASGDIIIFIDDDAVPIDKYYIENYVNSFLNDPELVATGGYVFCNDWKLQYKNGKVGIWGIPFCCYKEEDTIEQKVYNYVAGGNSAFLKKAVVEAGGYDEYYEYYQDETDLCVRLIKAGKKIKHHETAHIFHENARTLGIKSREHRNWSIISKNHCYFSLKNSEGLYDLETRRYNIISQARQVRNHIDYYLENKSITHDEYLLYIEMWLQGIKKGEYDGLNNERLLNYDLASDSSFMKIDKLNTPKLFNIVFLLPDHIDFDGENARYLKELTSSLIELDVGVHIVYTGTNNNDYMVDGINYYSVVPLSLNINSLEKYPICNNALNIAYSFYKKVKLLSEMYKIKLIEAPIWNFSSMLCAYLINIPVATRLEAKKENIRNKQNYLISDDMMLYLEYEKKLLLKSAYIISINNSILKTILNLYDLNIKDINDKINSSIKDLIKLLLKRN